MALVVEGATFAYGERVVLRGVDLSVEVGECVGVIGPNGSGKTTLLQLAAGLLRPQGGRVMLDGRAMGALSRREVARRVGVVPQISGGGFAFTVGQIVLMGRTPHLGVMALEGERDRAAAMRAMEYTETLALADRPMDALSGGERQRVLIARALAQEPAYLLLDEPTAFLDIRHQVRVHEMTLELCEGLRGLAPMGAVTVLHDLNLAGQFFHRLILLSQGEVVSRGQPTEVLTARSIEQAYGARVHVIPQGPAGGPVIVPLGSGKKGDFSTGCGAG